MPGLKREFGLFAAQCVFVPGSTLRLILDDRLQIPEGRARGAQRGKAASREGRR